MAAVTVPQKSSTIYTCYQNIIKNTKLSSKLPSRRTYSATKISYHKNITTHVKPYSQSIPSPGHNWCSRCNIRCHSFQKPINEHNACLDSPQLFGLGICDPAKQYWMRQTNAMVAMFIMCFVVFPSSKPSTEEPPSCNRKMTESRLKF